MCEQYTLPDGQRQTPCHLNESHRAELLKSGISDELIQRAGIYSANGALHDILGWLPKGLNSWGEGFVIPYHDQDDPSFARVKLDFPRKHKDGGPIKYESPLKKPNRPYFPTGFWTSIESAEVPIILTEGEKKALSATQFGLACIGLPGVWSFALARTRRQTGKATGARFLMMALNHIQWNGRKVYIAFDSDREEKREVRQAESELAEMLIGRGADVSIVKLPPGARGEKVGLDDYLVANGADAFRALMQSARAENIEPKDKPESLPPMVLADKYIGTKLMHADGCILRHWRDEFYQWDGHCYQVVPDGDFSKRVLVWLDTVVDLATPRMAENVAKCAAARVLVDHKREIPLWHGDGGPGDPRDWLAMSNGIVDLRTIINGETPEPRDHSPRWFSPICLPYAYAPGADCPKWRAFIEEVMEGDED